MHKNVFTLSVSFTGSYTEDQSHIFLGQNNLILQQQQHFISPHNVQEIKIYNNSTDDDRGAGCPK